MMTSKLRPRLKKPREPLSAKLHSLKKRIQKAINRYQTLTIMTQGVKPMRFLPQKRWVLLTMYLNPFLPLMAILTNHPPRLLMLLYSQWSCLIHPKTKEMTEEISYLREMKIRSSTNSFSSSPVRLQSIPIHSPTIDA